MNRQEISSKTSKNLIITFAIIACAITLVAGYKFSNLENLLGQINRNASANGQSVESFSGYIDNGLDWNMAPR
jgi:hypothetical protein